MNALTPWFSSRHEKSEDPPVVLLVTQQSSNKLKEKKEILPKVYFIFSRSYLKHIMFKMHSSHQHKSENQQ